MREAYYPIPEDIPWQLRVAIQESPAYQDVQKVMACASFTIRNSPRNEEGHALVAKAFEFLGQTVAVHFRPFVDKHHLLSAGSRPHVALMKIVVWALEKYMDLPPGTFFDPWLQRLLGVDQKDLPKVVIPTSPDVEVQERDGITFCRLGLASYIQQMTPGWTAAMRHVDAQSDPKKGDHYPTWLLRNKAGEQRHFKSRKYNTLSAHRKVPVEEPISIKLLQRHTRLQAMRSHQPALCGRSPSTVQAPGTLIDLKYCDQTLNTKVPL